MGAKIVIVMPYYNRQTQLNRTLSTITTSSYNHVEVVIVDDASDTGLIIPTRRKFKYNIHQIKIPKEKKFWTSCAVIPYNQGIQKALDLKADIIVLQNPENFHVGDVLSHVSENTTEGVYTTYGCFSLPKGETDEKLAFTTNVGIGTSGELGWYNHSIYRPCMMEFFGVLTRQDMLTINGYDERYADGVACGDCDLLRRIKNAGISCQIIDTPFVVHQWHYDGKNPYDDTVRFQRNQDLYFRLEKEEKTAKAVHIFTKDLIG